MSKFDQLPLLEIKGHFLLTNIKMKMFLLQIDLIVLPLMALQRTRRDVAEPF